MSQLENMTVTLNVWEQHFDPEQMLREETRLAGTCCLSIIHYLTDVQLADQKNLIVPMTEVTSQHTVHSPLWLKGGIEGSCELKVTSRQLAPCPVL